MPGQGYYGVLHLCKSSPRICYPSLLSNLTGPSQLLWSQYIQVCLGVEVLEMSQTSEIKSLVFYPVTYNSYLRFTKVQIFLGNT